LKLSRKNNLEVTLLKLKSEKYKGQKIEFEKESDGITAYVNRRPFAFGLLKAIASENARWKIRRDIREKYYEN